MFNTSTVNDRITAFTDLSALRHSAFGVLDMVDGKKPELRYLAPGIVFVTMGQMLNRDPHADIARLRRMVQAAEGPFTEHLQAIRDYVKGEMT